MKKNTCQLSGNTELYRTIKVKKYRYNREKKKKTKPKTVEKNADWRWQKS